jgi:hypothetical protein
MTFFKLKKGHTLPGRMVGLATVKRAVAAKEGAL